MNRTWMPTVAGILSIVAGALSLIGGFFGALIFSLFASSSYWDNTFSPNVAGALVWLFFLPYLIICGVSIAGGIFALRRRLWGFALAGAICAFLTIWAWALGIAAIVFVVLSRAEFTHTGPSEPMIVVPPPH